MADFEELRELAADVRILIEAAEDKAAVLRNIITTYDVVFAIYPSDEGTGIHIVKGRQILNRVAKSQTTAMSTHTAIAVPDLRHAEMLKQLTEPVAQPIAA